MLPFSKFSRLLYGRICMSKVSSTVSTQTLGSPLQMEPFKSRIWCQNVRQMGRGPTIQGRKNATDAVRRHKLVFSFSASGALTLHVNRKRQSCLLNLQRNLRLSPNVSY
jgi:hypothetical protein